MHYLSEKINWKLVEKDNTRLLVHSNEIACRKSGRLGLEQVKNTVKIFLRQSENPGNENKTQKKPAQLITIENMEAAKDIITEKSLFIVHSVRGRLEGAINFSYDTVI